MDSSQYVLFFLFELLQLFFVSVSLLLILKTRTLQWALQWRALIFVSKLRLMRVFRQILLKVFLETLEKRLGSIIGTWSVAIKVVCFLISFPIGLSKKIHNSSNKFIYIIKLESLKKVTFWLKTLWSNLTVEFPFSFLKRF